MGMSSEVIAAVTRYLVADGEREASFQHLQWVWAHSRGDHAECRRLSALCDRAALTTMHQWA
jgi:hypothetical protein